MSANWGDSVRSGSPSPSEKRTRSTGRVNHCCCHVIPLFRTGRQVCQTSLDISQSIGQIETLTGWWADGGTSRDILLIRKRSWRHETLHMLTTCWFDWWFSTCSFFNSQSPLKGKLWLSPFHLHSQLILLAWNNCPGSLPTWVLSGETCP